jgi:hypothetical protein
MNQLLLLASQQALLQCGPVRVFGEKITLRSAIEFRTFAPLDALPCV